MQRKDLLNLGQQVRERAGRDDVPGLAAEISCRTFLELFPLFIFLSVLGGWLAGYLHVQNPAQQVLDLLSATLPGGAADPIRKELQTVLATQRPGLVGLSVLGALWAAAGGGVTLLKAMNRAYEVRETRPWWERHLVGLGMALLAGGVFVGALVLLALGQVVDQALGGSNAPGWFQTLADFARWPLLAVLLLVQASIVFRVAPNQKQPWKWVTPGAVLFTLGWMAASALFVLYVNWAGAYASMYGIVGGVVVLILWLQLTAYALMLGAELNALLESPAARPAEHALEHAARDHRRAA